MRATVMYSAHDVRVENVPDATIVEPTDAIVRVTQACICGSDLWPYRAMEPSETGQSMGHEAIGVVEAIGSGVNKIKVGDVVIMPFAYSDGRCEFCHEGLQTACVHGGFFGYGGFNGAQAEALRIPQADGTLYALPGGVDSALMASLLTLSDVMGTGHHAARVARVRPGTSAAVIGDGAVGLCGVIAAKRLGAERIILMGRHPDRIALAQAFGATDIVSERGEEAIERVRALTAAMVCIRCSNVSVPISPCKRLQISHALAARWAVSACRITTRYRLTQHSSRMSLSVEDRRRCAPTLTICCPTYWTARFNLAVCSTALSAWTKSQMATGLWTNVKPSRS